MARRKTVVDEVTAFNAPYRSTFGGFARACKYDPFILSEWAAMGGRAVLQKYGREHFVEMRKRRKTYSRRQIEPEGLETDLG